MKIILNLILISIFLPNLIVANANSELDDKLMVDILNTMYQCPKEFIGFLSNNSEILSIKFEEFNNVPGPSNIYHITANNENGNSSILKITKQYVAREIPPYEKPGTWIVKCEG